jgi:hypothetical protein
MLQTGMGRSRGKILVIAALAVLFAQVQCAAACTIQSCTAKVPPCHRHHQSPCHEDVGVATASAPIMAGPAVCAWDIAPAAHLEAAEDAGYHALMATDASPPGWERSAILVLRI